jgi:glyoxylase-like metal-dependent hydrolase (beta-lactamase superfamily II)
MRLSFQRGRDMEIADNFHMIRSGYYGIYTAAYLITGKKLTLIDTGDIFPADSWNDDIKPYLRLIHRDPNEVELVILTHNHDDHMSGARKIRQETGAAIACGEITACFLSKPFSIMEYDEKVFEGYITEDEKEQILLGNDYNGSPRHLRTPLKVDHVLKNGEIVDTGPFHLKVIHTPGHTVDSNCLYDEDEKMLVSGDTVCGEATETDDLSVIHCLDDFELTLRRLEKLSINMLLMSHPFLPFREAVLKGEMAKEMIRMTISVSNKITAKTLEALENADRSMTTAEIASYVISEVRHKNVRPRSHGTVRINLLRHLSEGRISVTKRNGEILWFLKK